MAAAVQVASQNDRLKDIFLKARRADLRLPQRPRVSLEISEED